MKKSIKKSWHAFQIIKKYKIIILMLIISIPLILTVFFSFFSYYKYPQILPTQFTLDYWENLFFHNSLFFESIKNSIFIGLMNALFSTLFGFMAARALVKENLTKKLVFTYLYSLPLFIPATALFIGVHMMMIRLSFMNSYIGIIIAHMLISMPYATNIGVSFFEGIPTDMELLARTLGCSDRQLFKKVILPMLLPGLLFSIPMCFLLSLSEYFAAFLIGGGKIITVSTLLYPYINNADYGNSATLSIVFIAINMGVFFAADYITHRVTKTSHYLFE